MAHDEPRRPHRVVHLDDVEGIPGPGTLTWHPVRAHLGIRAFGTNAYTAAEAGQDVVEPHTENPQLAHEELYFVARGRATFTIDGETIRSEEHTSELQSRPYLVCRLLLEKKKKNTYSYKKKKTRYTRERHRFEGKARKGVNCEDCRNGKIV